MIPDDGYSEGDSIKIKYDPDKPSDYYLDDGETDDTPEDDTPDDSKSRMIGVILAVLGILVIVGGIALYRS